MRNLIATCNVQLGDNPNFFPDAAYIGYTLEIPVKIDSIDQSATLVSLVISTSVIETLAGDGHWVYINDQVVGRLKDVSGSAFETSIIEIPVEQFRLLVLPKKFMLLKIRIDSMGDPASGLLDDFIVKKIEIENVVTSTMTIP